MAKEAVDKILAAELSAEKTENDASTRAAEIVSGAESEAAEVIEKSRILAEKSAEEKILKAREEAEKIIADAENMEETELFEDLKTKKAEAIDAVINALI